MKPDLMQWLRCAVIPALCLSLAMPVLNAQQRALELEEVVVTARKRTESLLDVPLSITAVTQDQIERSGIDSIQDVADHTPGLSFNPAFGRVGSGQGGGSSNRPTMRGQPNILGSPNVGFFVDGVYVSGNITSYQLDNLERIEVIRGPQSALFGRGTFAGAVNFVTRKPGDELQGKVEVTAAKYDHYEATGYVSGPLIQGKLAGEINGRIYDRGGDWFNRASGQKDGGEESTLDVGGKLFWTPTDDLALEFNLGYSADEDGWFPAGYSGFNCLGPTPIFSIPGFVDIIGVRGTGYFCGEVNIDDRESFFMRTDIIQALGVQHGVDRETVRTSVKADYEFDNGWTLQGIGAYNQFNNEQSFDSNLENGEPSLRPAMSITQDRRKDFSAQFSIASPADRKVRGLAGAYYYREQDGKGYSGAAALPAGPIPLGASNVNPSMLSYNPTMDDSEVKNWSVFGSVEFEATESLLLTLEGRYQVDTIISDQDDSMPGNPLLEEDYDKFLPRATALYRLNDDWNLFANVARGNKPGGFNALPGDADDASRALLQSTLQTYDEETAWTYEFGVKGTNSAGNLSLSASVYQIDWERQQLTLPFSYNTPTGPDSSTAIQNAGETRVLGLEVDLNYRATENFAVRLAYAYVDSEIRDFVDPVSEDLYDTDGLVGEFDMAGDFNGQVAGNKAPQSPRNKATLTGIYTQPISDQLSWFLRADVSYESERFAQVHNLASSGDRTLVNLRTDIERDNWTVTLWADNLFDDRTPLSLTRLLNFNAPFISRPPVIPGTGTFFGGDFYFYRDMFISFPRKRTFGVTANFKF